MVWQWYKLQILFYIHDHDEMVPIIAATQNLVWMSSSASAPAIASAAIITLEILLTIIFEILLKITLKYLLNIIFEILSSEQKNLL